MRLGRILSAFAALAALGPGAAQAITFSSVTSVSVPLPASVTPVVTARKADGSYVTLRNDSTSGTATATFFDAANNVVGTDVISLTTGTAEAVDVKVDERTGKYAVLVNSDPAKVGDARNGFVFVEHSSLTFGLDSQVFATSGDTDLRLTSWDDNQPGLGFTARESASLFLLYGDVGAQPIDVTIFAPRPVAADGGAASGTLAGTTVTDASLQPSAMAFQVTGGIATFVAEFPLAFIEDAVGDSLIGGSAAGGFLQPFSCTFNGTTCVGDFVDLGTGIAGAFFTDALVAEDGRELWIGETLAGDFFAWDPLAPDADVASANFDPLLTGYRDGDLAVGRGGDYDLLVLGEGSERRTLATATYTSTLPPPAPVPVPSGIWLALTPLALAGLARIRRSKQH